MESQDKQSVWQSFSGSNMGYVQELYEAYRDQAESVDPVWRDFFAQWGGPPANIENVRAATPIHSPKLLQAAVAAEKLAQHIRNYGHLAAKIHPLNETPNAKGLLDEVDFHLSEEDLRQLPAELIWPYDSPGISSALDVIHHLQDIYTRTIAFQFGHVHDDEERAWLYEMVETGKAYQLPTNEERIGLLKKLIDVDSFEKFLHRTYVGQKRFSVEGLDILVPMVDEAVRMGIRNDARNVVIGMAHRGRLNMLAHVLGKPYEMLFAEFQHQSELVPSEGSRGMNYGWTGDVKYHLGANRDIDEATVRAHLTLANNPSHLEFVAPVAAGYTRAAQEDRKRIGMPVQDVSSGFAIIIHGDAAFPGEGIVAETLNLGRVAGYQTGGAIHIIANNQIGFTTEMTDSRSTLYASDLAKGYEIPIVYVNADDPDACIAAVHLAHAYRKRFKKDFLIDLIGYRRFGHNEMDDPAVTQPNLYRQVNHHPTVREIYANTLLGNAIIKKEDMIAMQHETQQRLQEAYEKVQAQSYTEQTSELREGRPKALSVETSVSAKQLQEIGNQLFSFPEGFRIYPKLEKILTKRLETFTDNGQIDWALAESLAYGTILQDGVPIRFTGQDTERGTFAHRHLVWHDTETGQTYTPLKNLPQAKASFAVYNSPLSEAAVLGFEYGYNVFAQDTFVLWEAQFGDFANTAQVIIDQFLAAGLSKWLQHSSMVLLLPHGYEGQGPEHSSGRLERFLQLSAENNWIVANVTSAAQYFHLLRRQANLVGQKSAVPLIVMTPKSLLRHPRTASRVEAFSNGQFQAVIEQLGSTAQSVERCVICSGKIAVELQEQLEMDEEAKYISLIRIEELYPFPRESISRILGQYSNLREIVWVQEEPKNMGAWTYMEPRLREIMPAHLQIRYIGRPDRSSPAEGLPDMHKREQHHIIREAFTFAEARVSK